ARAGHAHAPAEGLRLPAVGRQALVVAHQDEGRVARRRLAPEAQQQIEPLAREAAADGRAHPLAVREAEGSARRRPERRAPRGMKAPEIDAVVEDAEPPPRP